MTLEGAHGKTVDEVNRLIPPKFIRASVGQSCPAMEGTNHDSKGTGEGARRALKVLWFPRELPWEIISCSAYQPLEPYLTQT
jgi:hypothetical protein